MAPIIKYIDSHAHLFDIVYSEDMENVILRAHESGVGCIIVPGINLKTSYAAVELAEKYEKVFACIGVHPHEASKMQEKNLKEIEDLVKHPKVVAIGEIGIDYHYNFSPGDRQKSIFEIQLEMAANKNLPVVIHTRESMQDTLQIVENILKNNPDWRKNRSESKRGVFHCFPGTVEEATKIMEMNFYISYTGMVTFHNSESVEIVKELGIDNLLLETDSPYMSPVPFRGKRNEPSNIVLIGRKIAEILNISEEEVASVTTKNAVLLFKLPEL